MSGDGSGGFVWAFRVVPPCFLPRLRFGAGESDLDVRVGAGVVGIVYLAAGVRTRADPASFWVAACNGHQAAITDRLNPSAQVIRLLSSISQHSGHVLLGTLRRFPAR